MGERAPIAFAAFPVHIRLAQIFGELARSRGAVLGVEAQIKVEAALARIRAVSHRILLTRSIPLR